MGAKCLPIADSTAARWISIPEAAARSGIPERTLRHNCPRWSRLGRATRHSGEWRLDPALDERFVAAAGVDDRASILDIRQVSGAKRARANVRRQVLIDADKFAAARMRQGLGRAQAMQEFAALYGQTGYAVRFSWRTLYNWQQAARLAPATGLIDKRGLTAPGPQEPDAEIVHLFCQRYLHPNKPSLRSVYDEILSLCDRTGKWCWGSYTTFRRWVKATYPQAVLTLNREGEQAYRQKHEPAIEQDPDTWSAGEVYVGDHHQFRVMVRHRGQIIRPWLTAWMDARSLTFVGWQVVAAPNQSTICTAWAHACRRHGPARIAMMDNGRDYSSYAVAGGTSRRAGLTQRAGYLDEAHVGGLMALCGTEARFVLPHAPNSKIIEGMFRPIEDQLCRKLPNYCGADPADRPEDFHQRIAVKEAIPSLEEFTETVRRWIEEVYNVRPQSGKYCAGQSPLAVFDARRTTENRLADPRVLDLFGLTWSREIKVGRKGIRFLNLHYGAWDPQVIALHGQMVRVSYDPADISQVMVWTLDHRFLFTAQQNALINRNVTDEDRRDGHRIKARLKRAMTVVRERGHLSYADNAELALTAQREAARRAEGRTTVVAQAPLENPAIRLIQTPLDGQSNAIRSALITEAARAVDPGADDLRRRLLEARPAAAESIPLPLPATEDNDAIQPAVTVEPADDDPAADDLMRRLRSAYGEES